MRERGTHFDRPASASVTRSRNAASGRSAIIPNCCDAGRTSRMASASATRWSGPTLPPPECPRSRPIGNYPNCCERGTHFDDGVCKRDKRSGPTLPPRSARVAGRLASIRTAAIAGRTTTTVSASAMATRAAVVRALSRTMCANRRGPSAPIPSAARSGRTLLAALAGATPSHRTAVRKAPSRVLRARTRRGPGSVNRMHRLVRNQRPLHPRRQASARAAASARRRTAPARRPEVPRPQVQAHPQAHAHGPSPAQKCPAGMKGPKCDQIIVH